MFNLLSGPKVFHFIKRNIRRCSTMDGDKTGSPLSKVIEVLENFAPLSLAEVWDNVGLLVEPPVQRPIRTVFLTNDLTLSSLNEAQSKNSDLIISYHPPIFAGLKRLTQQNWKERIVTICLAQGIAIYSPHTAWDCTRNGVNDWLASALPASTCDPIKVNPVTYCGPGRFLKLKPEFTLKRAIDAIQKHIGLDIHVAIGVNQTLDSVLKTAGICAGSGGSLLKDLVADLYLTGEMSHHEILDAQHRGTSVILCNHSNSERGFLKYFKPMLSDLLNGKCEIIVSECDKDPLNTFVFKK